MARLGSTGEGGGGAGSVRWEKAHNSVDQSRGNVCCHTTEVRSGELMDRGSMDLKHGASVNQAFWLVHFPFKLSRCTVLSSACKYAFFLSKSFFSVCMANVAVKVCILVLRCLCVFSVLLLSIVRLTHT